MCRSTDHHGFYQTDQRGDRLKIRAFYLRFLISNAGKSLPESLTLLYLPRISGSPLEINGTKIKADLAAFVTLHRIRSAEMKKREAVFASRERVRVGEGVRFEVYMREEKVLKGIFRKDEEEDWKLECKCALESGEEEQANEVAEVEVSVVGEGHVAIDERVEMVVRKRRKCRGFQGLEEIPEVREVDEEEEEQMDGCDCSSCCGDVEEGSGSDGGDCEEEEEEEGKEEIEMEMEGVRWAVDVGLWVMCLGVGYLVSKASSKSLTRRKFL